MGQETEPKNANVRFRPTAVVDSDHRSDSLWCMRTAIFIILAAIALGGCSRSGSSEYQVTDGAEDSTRLEPSRGEMPVSKAEAANLAAEFGLAECSITARLRDTRSDEISIQSWRVQDSGQCNRDWVDRQGQSSIFKVIDTSQVERDQLPWLCSENDAHVSECVSQGVEPTLLIRQQRLSEYLVFHRITKIAK